MRGVRFRLSVMMFLQYFVWGAWGVAMGGYMNSTLGFSGPQIGWIYASSAIGAMISPLFLGYVADRLFATEKILAILHMVGGLLLIVAARLDTFPPLLTVMILYAVCYMPTLALTNSISFHNIGDPQKEFPRIRVWGTIGWIVAGLVIGILIGQADSTFIYLAGAASIALALFCLTLPHTPPKGRDEAAGDVFGFGALGLLREPAFAVFVGASFLICIPLAFYYNWANAFLVETDAPVPTALQTLGQFSEVFFMALMPLFILRLGVKWMLVVGMLAWVTRYFLFGSLVFPLVVVGLILHGICYDFFFVASQIYVDQKAPRDLRASAQSFIAFVTLGLGMFVGAQVSGQIVEAYPPVSVAALDAAGETVDAPLPAWRSKEQTTGLMRYLDPAVLRPLIFPTEEAPQPPDFAEENDANGDGLIQRTEIPDVWLEQADVESTADDVTYSRESLLAAFDEIDANRDGALSRAEWRKAQAHTWEIIWLWPAGMAGVALLIFVFGFHDPAARRPPRELREQAGPHRFVIEEGS